jgi:hypothetical protein
MKTFTTVYYWIRVAALVLAVVLALLAAVRLTGRRRFAVRRDVAFAAAAVVAFGGLTWITGVSFSIVWAVVLVLLGATAGFSASRGARFSMEEGRPYVNHSPVAPWIWAVGAILVALTLLFGTSYLFALAMLVLAFGMGTVLGEVAAELGGSRPEGAAADGAGAGGPGQSETSASPVGEPSGAPD